ncbi:MAG: aminotransferase class V-fold PLP-dependent enzyme [Pseudomonadota bacterium]
MTISCQRHLFDIPRDVAYLNCAYMSPLLNSVVEAVDRGARMKATPWTLTIPDFYDSVDRARSLAAGLLNADAEGMAIVPSASYGIETAVRNLTLGEGRRVVMLANQFPSHVYPWRRMARDQGGEVFMVDVPPGEAATDAVLAAIDERCAVAALPNVLWTNGALVDLVAVRKRCDEVGAALVLDLTQSAGAMVTDFAAIRPDFAVVAGYKWFLSPYATGFLYAAPHRRDGEPMEEGWIIREDSRNFSGLTAYTDRYEPGAVRYDMGERANFALMPGVVAALEQLTEWGIAHIEATLAERNRGLSARLSALGLTPTPDHARGPHFIGATLPEGAPDDLLAQLAAEKIYLSERSGSLRVTPHLWCDDEDFDRLIDALGRLL